MMFAWETVQPDHLAAAIGPLLASQLTEVMAMTCAAFTATLAGDLRAVELYEAACAAAEAKVVRDNTALAMVALLGELDVWNEQPDRARLRYDMLVPFRGYVVITGAFVTIPTLVDFVLGKLAHHLDRPAAARDHLTAAGSLAQRLESPSWSNRCSVALQSLSEGRSERLPLR
jgi:hypothetical protein